VLQWRANSGFRIDLLGRMSFWLVAIVCIGPSVSRDAQTDSQEAGE
jgi:hypothetical protein